MEITRPATGDVRTTLDERVQATRDALTAEGYEQGQEEERALGLARERELLTRLAQQRFGAETAADLTRHLADVAQHEQLLKVSDWILACTSGAELLERVAD